VAIREEARRLAALVEAQNSKVRFWVRVCRPGDSWYPWTLHDGAVMIRDGLRELGYKADFEPTGPDFQSGWWTREQREAAHKTVEIQIIIGGNCATQSTADSVPDGSIVYQLEQAGTTNHFTPIYLGLLRRCIVWDYHPYNTTQLEKLHGIKALYVPFSYVDAFGTAPSHGHAPEFDVIFLGAINPPRAKVLNELEHLGLKVYKDECYGENRANMLLRSRVVLNIHFYQNLKVLELCRIGIGMSAKKAVISQYDSDVKGDPFFLPTLVCAPLEELAMRTKELCDDHAKCERLGEEGFKLFSSRRAAGILEKALADTTVRPAILPENYVRTSDPRLPVYRHVR
jgi:hypothetical protein